MGGRLEDDGLPHNLDAERSVLGAILVRNEALHDVPALQPGHFYRQAHAHMFKALLDLEASGSALDFVTLKAELFRTGLLEECGGPMYLSGLADGMPRATNIQHYAQLVQEDAVRRVLIDEADRLRRAAMLSETSPRELLETTEARLFTLDQRADGGHEPVGAAETYREMFPVIDQLWTGGGRGSVRTGLVDLDRMTRGFKAGELIVVGARPSMGKSALLLQMALHISVGLEVLVSSLEMTRRELFLRAVSMLTEQYGTDCVGGDIRPNATAQQAIGRAMTAYSQLKLAVDETAALSVSRLRAKARRLAHQQHGLGCILVDYLQLLRPEAGRREDNRAIELGRISGDLKLLAKELQVPVIVASQLNRELEHRTDKHPTLSDIRESGAIEQDADIVLLLHRPAYYDKAKDPTYAELYVAKQRNGPTGVVSLTWKPDITTFCNRLQKPCEAA